jgi:hypothetical protein
LDEFVLWTILLMCKAYFQSFTPVALAVSHEKNYEFSKKIKMSEIGKKINKKSESLSKN